MDVQQREYDRFGPWVTEISAEDPVPPLFAPHVKDQESALLSLKIPRRIERRDASPGMDLYDYLVSAYEDHLIILKRDGRSVSSRRWEYGEIQIVHFIEDLLDGRLQLVVESHGVDLPFNSVSSEAMKKLLHVIRERFADDTTYATDALVVPEPNPGLSFYFQGRLTEYAAKWPRFRLCATQAEISVGHAENRGLRRFFFRLFRRRLTESLHYSDGRELVVVHHGRRFGYMGRPIYAQHTTYIPVKRMTAVEWVEDPANASLVTLAVATEAARFTVGFAKDNPCISGYSAFLSNALQAGSGS